MEGYPDVESNLDHFFTYSLSYHHPAVGAGPKLDELVSARVIQLRKMLTVLGAVKMSDEMVDHIISTKNNPLVSDLIEAQQMWFDIEFDPDRETDEDENDIHIGLDQLLRHWTVDEPNSVFYVGTEDLRSYAADTMSDWEF